LVVVWAIVIVVLVRFLGDRWWVGTLALFSPRWLLLAPLVVGALVWPWCGRWGRWSLVGAVAVVWWGVSGLCVPLGGWGAKPKMVYRILTCNVAGTMVDTLALEALIADSRADVVVLQEYTDSGSISLPDAWSSQQRGNLFTASRFPIANASVVNRDLPDRWPRPVGFAADVITPERTLSLATVHLLSPRKGLGQIVNSRMIVDPSKRGLLIDSMNRRESESRHVAEFVDSLPESIVVAGDFNMPVESYFFRSHWGSFRDAFESVGFGFGNTCFVRQGGIRFGARIDHVLTRGNWRTLRCRVGADVGSDHLPVIADVYWEE
jgi:vancomycin resistance protein VanJ